MSDNQDPGKKDEHGFLYGTGKAVEDFLERNASPIANFFDTIGLTSLFKSTASTGDGVVGAIASGSRVITGNGRPEDYENTLSGLMKYGLPGIVGFLLGYKISDGKIINSMLFAAAGAAGFNIIKGMITNAFNSSARDETPGRNKNFPAPDDVRGNPNVVGNKDRSLGVRTDLQLNLEGQ